MSILAELQILVRALTRWFLWLGIVLIVLFSCGVTWVTWYGYTAPILWPGGTSVAAAGLLWLIETLVPVGVPVVIVSPAAAFIAQVKVAFMMALIITVPILLVHLVRYLSPALTKTERRALIRLIVPLSLLFALGAYFAVRYVVPITLTVLYAFTVPLGITSFLGVSEFIATTVALVLMTSIAFTTPVAMIAITQLGLVSGRFWLDKANYALIGFLIVSAIITPDGSGVSMLLLAGPVSVLYGVGMVVSMRLSPTKRIDTHHIYETN